METNKIKEKLTSSNATPKVAQLAECSQASYDAELRNVNYGKKVQREGFECRLALTQNAEPVITKGIHSKL
ncbi:MAG: hypothetical protein ACNYPH_01810 [Gammaproteobacteria bacterium WSBS_2016_MAG_OTU1]